jgi:RNA polymerase subunit RPABC4/transcription elongation factor Spt4
MAKKKKKKPSVCWNCKQPLPRGAKFCPQCESPTDAGPTPGEEKLIREFLEDMDPDARAEIDALVQESDTAEEFVRKVFVGDCPKCGSSHTSDCDSDPEIDDILVGRCYDCGQFWCLECELLLDKGVVHCPRCEE